MLALKHALFRTRSLHCATHLNAHAGARALRAAQQGGTFVSFVRFGSFAAITTFRSSKRGISPTQRRRAAVHPVSWRDSGEHF